ncbi:MAG: HD domain-containing protein [Phycisphaeraceae bacterium]|nr:HD domain-containing protein [Phycisphaerales bacterium]MCB9859628.1 HD domain-containing protein [Phycisphaeraceae bacterium]
MSVPRKRSKRVIESLAQSRQSFIVAVLALQVILIIAFSGSLFYFLGKQVSSFMTAHTHIAWQPLTSSIERTIQIAGFVLLAVMSIGLSVIARMHHASVSQIGRILEKQVKQRVGEALASRHALILGLAKLADYRDSDTGAHLERISAYVELIAQHLSKDNTEITTTWIEQLKLASSLHDIGKVGVPDSVLLKPGKLTQEEREQMQLHTNIGADTLIAVRQKMGPDPLIDMSVQIALQHHERWDGDGYPMQLKADEIALPARIIALADFYDALTSKRVYKPACSHEQTRDMIYAESGKQFDPKIVEAFIACEREFDEIRTRMQPSETELKLVERHLKKRAA